MPPPTGLDPRVAPTATGRGGAPGLCVSRYPETPMQHPDNAPGDFYVEYDCCTSCEVPRTVAPDLFAYDAAEHCYVRRQPTSPEDTDRMIQVTAEQELECIRYRGSDPAILGRVEAQFCDETPEGAASLRHWASPAPQKPRWWQFWRRD